jgi:demethylmenaquinone methyltransferase/2-methoxy-6-polyprenyl-1,4-benzoquinol methylase
MFAAIAPRYDLLNHLLSLSVDRYWRWRVVRHLAAEGPASGDRCLDLCAGTGDLALGIHRRLGLETIGVDFCHPMLLRFQEKLGGAGTIRIAESDAQSLPFSSGQFRFVTVAFGLRNIEDRPRALGEMLRVLGPGGVVVVLEFSRPVLPLVRGIFGAYFDHVLPRIGAWVSGREAPYRYLPDSVRSFPDQKTLAGELDSAGFVDVGYRNLTFGIAALHWGSRPQAQVELKASPLRPAR